jgi:hypothetical protein
MCTLARFGQFVCDGHHTMVDFERRQRLEDVAGAAGPMQTAAAAIA